MGDHQGTEMTVRRTIAPAAEPITVDEAKIHLGITFNDHDARLATAISAARMSAEQYMERTIIASTWVLTLDQFSDSIRLPWPRVTTIDEVAYVDADGASQVLSDTLYSLDNASELQNWLLPAYDTTWPTTRDQANAVTVTYTAGWADASAVPDGIKQFVKMMVGGMYHQISAVETAPMPMTAFMLPHEILYAMLDPWKVTET
jgi:uncharacterized phiE125 gp8 family phage protein